MNRVYVSVALASLLLVGCGEKQESEDVSEVAKEVTQSAKSVEEAPISKGIYGTSAQSVQQSVPIEMHAPKQMQTDQEPPVQIVQETALVLDTKDAGGYIYVLIEDGNGEKLWIAGPKTELSVGQMISFAPQMMMENFPSKKLNKTFDRLLFVATIAPLKGATAAAAKEDDCSNCDTHKAQRAAKEQQELVASDAAKVTQSTQAQPSNPHTSAAQTTTQAVQSVVVTKADGGYTIAELYQNKSDLNGTVVKVRGEVTKVSRGIMGRDWVHLRDDSRGEGSTDFVVTSPSANVAVADVVVASGVLKNDVDFGYGYFYSVIIEDTSFSK